MARTLVETPLTTRTERRRLACRRKPYWNRLGPREKLGYRKNIGVSSWLASTYDPTKSEGSKYREVMLGPTDDDPGPGTLSYDQAVAKALSYFAEVRRAAEIEAVGPAITIAMSVQGYVEDRDARESKRKGRSVRSDASRRLHRYILGQAKRGKSPAISPAPIAAKTLQELEEEDLLAWRESLPKEMRATSKQRLINDFKAALNTTYAANRKSLPPTLSSAIKFGLRAIRSNDEDEDHSIARKNQILDDGDIARLIQAARDVDHEQGWEGDLFRIILVLAAPGRVSHRSSAFASRMCKSRPIVSWFRNLERGNLRNLVISRSLLAAMSWTNWLPQRLVDRPTRSSCIVGAKFSAKAHLIGIAARAAPGNQAPKSTGHGI